VGGSQPLLAVLPAGAGAGAVHVLLMVVCWVGGWPVSFCVHTPIALPRLLYGRPCSPAAPSSSGRQWTPDQTA
jgi:hypothetical protein